MVRCEKVAQDIPIENRGAYWIRELETKNRTILQLERRVFSLEESLQSRIFDADLQELLEELARKDIRIEDLEDAVTEFQDLVKSDPDAKELRDLRQRVRELESETIDKERVAELEIMVTKLEDYVRSHNIDVLEGRLKEREYEIFELRGRLDRANRDNETQTEFNNSVTTNNCPEIVKKMKDMEHAISEKDNALQDYHDRLNGCLKRIRDIERQLSEKICARDEKIAKLEKELTESEKIVNERIKDFEELEALMDVIRENENRERVLKREVLEGGRRIDQLSEALEQSVAIVDQAERDLKREKRDKRNAIQWVLDLQDEISQLQEIVCQNCQNIIPMYKNDAFNHELPELGDDLPYVDSSDMTTKARSVRKNFQRQRQFKNLKEQADYSTEHMLTNAVKRHQSYPDIRTSVNSNRLHDYEATMHSGSPTSSNNESPITNSTESNATDSHDSQESR